MNKKSSYIIVGHIYTTGPGEYLEKYLVPRSSRLVFIGHPFPYTKKPSFLKIYKNKKLVKEEKFFNLSLPDNVSYVKDIILTIWWTIKFGRKTEYYIGCDNINACTGFLLKKLGLVGKTIFYTIDYIPKRFTNTLLNTFYHFLDSFAVRKSDFVWNLSPIMVSEREKMGISKELRQKQITVPIGTILPKQTTKQIQRNTIVFIGHLRKNQGIELLIHAMKKISQKIPQVKLLIIGGGPLENNLQELVKKLHLSFFVTFTGFLPHFSDAQKYLQSAGIGVAPYTNDTISYTRYTDPGKPKDYLSFGMPVVITKVPQVAYEIEKRKCGLAIDYSQQQLEQALCTLLRMPENDYNLYRKNALKMAKRYIWTRVFDNAFSATLKQNTAL